MLQLLTLFAFMLFPQQEVKVHRYGVAPSGYGAGVVIADNYVLTNYHNLAVGAKYRAGPFKARVLKYDSYADLALLYAPGVRLPKPVRLGDWPQDGLSRVVYHGGFSHDQWRLRVTVCRNDRASGLPGMTAKMLHVDLSTISPGDSGGGVYLDGKLIGIICAIHPQSQSAYAVGPKAIHNFLWRW